MSVVLSYESRVIGITTTETSLLITARSSLDHDSHMVSCGFIGHRFPHGLQR